MRADLVTEIMGSIAPRAAYEVARLREDYAVLLVRTERIVVKLAGDGAPYFASAAAFERAAALSRMLTDQGISTPRVLAVDTSCKRWPVRYLVSTFIDGTSWASASADFDAADRATVFTELGEAVGLLHAVRFDAFGELDPFGTVEHGGAYPGALSTRLARRIRFRRRVRALLTTHAAALAGVIQPALTHEDLNHTNLVVARRGGCWHLAGILDLDSAWAGNPESDLAKLELWHGMRHPAFWSGYGRIPAPGYATRRALLQLLWCLEYAQPTTDHHAVTARVCAQLGLAPISFDV